MRCLHAALCAAVVLGSISLAQAEIITGVDRSGGVSDNRAPIGTYDEDTDPLATQAGGLTPGNLYFSDREFAIDVVPAPLDGAEYVRTFNSDKGNNGSNVNYAVTTGEMAYLYLLVDDRLTDIQAKVDGIVSAFASAGVFTDTGIDVTIDEANGPTQSVYGASAAYAAGTYNFGAQVQNDSNFYSIVATSAPVPEPSTLVLFVLALLGVAMIGRRR